MKPKDFSVGLEFYTHTGRWKCTNVGQDIIIAVKVSNLKWYNRLFYSLIEFEFDEYNMEGSELNTDDL